MKFKDDSRKTIMCQTLDRSIKIFTNEALDLHEVRRKDYR